MKDGSIMEAFQIKIYACQLDDCTFPNKQGGGSKIPHLIELLYKVMLVKRNHYATHIFYLANFMSMLCKLEGKS